MSPVAATPLGRLQGVLGADGVERYLGVPYASVPARFEPARPLTPWVDVRDASAYGPAAPQVPTMLEKLLSGDELAMDEADCLTLNVWTPAADAAGRPVLVWIHGGAFATGTGRSRWYDGAALARRGDVVVVTINYRLGVLGFTHGLGPGSGNLGLLDQIEALRWVQANIAALGGDPGNVTVFGESAGAASIAAHLAASPSPMFRRAVLQSGAHNLLKTVAQADETAARVLAVVDGDASRLATMTTAEVLAVHEAATPRAGGVFYGPVTDGDVVPADPAGELAAGRSTVPVLVGTNRDEMGFFWGRAEQFDHVDPGALRAMVARWHDDPDGVITTYRTARAERGEPVDERSLLVAIGTDATFRAGAMAVAAWQAGGRGRSHAYRFDHETPLYDGLVGAGHVLEVPFVFGTQAHPGVAAYTGADVDPDGTAALADEMGAAWFAFARDGEPGWPAYAAAARTTRRFGGAGGEFTDDGAELAVWDPFRLP